VPAEIHSPDWLKQFVECIETSTVASSRIAEAIEIKQQYLPKRIYKYRRNCLNARTNLENDTVWMSSPEFFNDPYDCLFKVSEQLLSADLEEKLLAQNVEPEKSLHASKVHALKAIEEIRRWRKLTKVSCFNSINDSILMWGHYAESHKGFCIEYDIESLAPQHNLCRKLFPVIYTSKIYDLTEYAKGLSNMNHNDFRDIWPLLSLLHKYEGWKYEQEWRVVSITEKETPDHNWPMPKASRVFIGSEMNEAGQAEICSICNAKGIPVEKMHLTHDKYQLQPKPLT
jgi:hypothetical protein